ncbi:MAG: hypothetical protein V1706_06565 [Pseudomonadota bacterium]
MAALFTLAACASSPNNIVWHQQYEPLDTVDALSFTEKALKDAENIFGPPKIKIRQIHLRHSVPRKNHALLTRADITDWPHFINLLSTASPDNPAARIGSMLDENTRRAIHFSAEKNSANIIRQVTIIDGFNRLIQEKNLCGSEEFPSQLPGNSICQATEGKTKEPDPRLQETQNRRLLNSIFPFSMAPMAEKKSALAGIELCECYDCMNGIFIIYVSVSPSDPLFFPQLSHEALHLLNPYLYDWYIEGLSNVFSEKFSKENGYSWTAAYDHLNEVREKDPYAISYFMMREISEIAGEHLGSIFEYAAWSDGRQRKMHIDINSWLAALPADINKKVRGIIDSSASSLKKNKGSRNSFIIPEK